VQIKRQEGSEIHVEANFVVYRMRFQNIDPYIGRYSYILLQSPAGLKIRRRTATLDLEVLRPHGKVSFIV
jgi:p-cumate 2,3-dioxygenase beta subunit